LSRILNRERGVPSNKSILRLAAELAQTFELDTHGQPTFNHSRDKLRRWHYTE
jgi:hypothetical protein